jgi:uncharacterized protein YpmS
MKFKFVFFIIIALIFLHFILYFFNVDLFECFETIKQKEDGQMDNTIQELTQSLEQLKEINQ